MVEDKQNGGGSGRAPYDDYKELMDDSLNKIIKTVSKSKNKELVSLCQQALGKSWFTISYVILLGLCVE